MSISKRVIAGFSVIVFTPTGALAHPGHGVGGMLQHDWEHALLAVTLTVLAAGALRACRCIRLRAPRDLKSAPAITRRWPA